MAICQIASRTPMNAIGRSLMSRFKDLEFQGYPWQPIVIERQDT